jgi:amino acid transporter
MYVLMFVAALRLRRRQPEPPRGYRAPALVTICVVGVLASVAACVAGDLRGGVLLDQLVHLRCGHRRALLDELVRPGCFHH